MDSKQRPKCQSSIITKHLDLVTLKLPFLLILENEYES